MKERNIKSFLLFPFITGIIFIACLYGWLNYSQEKIPLNDIERKNAPGHFLELSHGLTHYVVNGSVHGIPIVFIHGGGVTGLEVWKNTVPYFTNKDFQVLTYDLYGRGFSDRPTREYTPELFQTQFTELLDSISFPQQFHIVSLSMGCMVAIEFAAKYPDRVKSLTLIDAAAAGNYKPNPLLKIPIASELLMTLYWYPRALENQRKEFVNQSLFKDYAERLKYFMQFKGYKHVNYSTWMNMLNQNKLPLLQSIPPNRILLVYGKNDPYFQGTHSAEYKYNYPTIKVVEIDRAGHMPHYEKPEQVNDVIYNFLTKSSGLR